MTALRASGLLGLLVPRSHGGLGGDIIDLVDVAQLLASGCLSTAMIWAMHSQQVDSIVRYAGPAFAEYVLPRIAKGELYLASVTTEPASGGNLMSASSALREEPDGMLRIEREAPVVTGGEHADAFLVTMLDSEEATENRVTLVYAERGDLTLNVTSEWNALGMRGTRSVGMRMDGLVPVENIIGKRGEYRTVAVESMIPLAHIAWSACWLGAARSAYSDVIALLRSRHRPGGVDLESDLFAERLARLRMDLELVSAYLNRTVEEVVFCRAAGRSLDTTPAQIHLNTLKVVAAEHTFRVVDGLVQLVGLAKGYLHSSTLPLERQFRDLRSASLNYANDRLLKATGRLALMDRSVDLA